VQFTPFVIWGFGGSANDFSGVRFPRICATAPKCHVNESQQVPVPFTRIAVQRSADYINPTPPNTAACTACHISEAASAHAATQTDAKLAKRAACATARVRHSRWDTVHARTM